MLNAKCRTLEETPRSLALDFAEFFGNLFSVRRR